MAGLLGDPVGRRSVGVVLLVDLLALAAPLTPATGRPGQRRRCQAIPTSVATLTATVEEVTARSRGSIPPRWQGLEVALGEGLGSRSVGPTLASMTRVQPLRRFRGHIRVQPSRVLRPLPGLWHPVLPASGRRPAASWPR